MPGSLAGIRKERVTMRSKLGMAVGMICVAIVLVAFSPVPAAEREVRRIQSHFDSVLVELRARDVAALSSQQQARRALLVETLATYRNRALFPRNYSFAAPTPYFVDRSTGVLCAVAHLLEATGRRDIVDRVAATDNNVWVAQLAGDTEFERWLDLNGITLKEAARIQVPYVREGLDSPGSTQRISRSVLPIASAAAATLSGAANLMWNRDGHSRIGNVVGLAAGATSFGVGLATMAGPREDRALAITSAAIGGVSALISTRGVRRHRQAAAAQRDADRARLAVAPLVPTSESGAGVSVNVRF